MADWMADSIIQWIVKEQNRTVINARLQPGVGFGLT